ncbi:MAG: VTT domain-containing protein [Planctomycetota bacterium]
MWQWLTDHAAQLVEHPILQAILLAVGTFIHEDAVTVFGGQLVAEDKMSFFAAYAGLATGITIGDLALYGLGRWCGPRLVSWGIVSETRLVQANAWFQRNLLVAVLVSRCLPGMRLATFVAAGISRASMMRFLVAVVIAVLIWTLLLLGLVSNLDAAVKEHLGAWKWPVRIGLIVGVVALQWWLVRRAVRKAVGESGAEPVVSRFELWPPTLFYFPVALYYFWLGVRHFSFTLPTAANPAIYAGGLIGESKSEILELVPTDQREWIAPYTLLPIGAPRPSNAALLATALAQLRATNLEFPVVAKPNRGQRGAGVQLIRDASALERYLARFPTGGEVMLQEFVSHPNEAGVLYHRMPGESHGVITSITLKYFPEVVGDGRRTVRELILDDARARYLAHVYLARHAARADHVLAVGERLALVFAGNHCQGTIFKDGTALLTPALLARLHGIAMSMPDFHFGRFDLRYRDLGALEQGHSFRIVEINGAGAEATHIWDSRVTLRQAYATLFRQYRLLFDIGAANRRRGHRTIGPWRLLRDVKAYRRLAAQYPPTD